MEFKTTLEKKAEQATGLDAFSKLNLHGVKDAVEKILEFIGRDGIFREYSRHDISHIDKLLELLEWIIPPGTSAKMTTADYLMTTLAVYFHDLGMAVTRDEFERRYESDFARFKDVQFAGSEGEDYRGKVSGMKADEAERFLYQEFVRQNHAERIRLWIAGKNTTRMGAAERVSEEVDKVLEGLDDRFRKDLGMVCASHHHDDLDDLNKYKHSQPYGSNPEEAVNLQYCAILLRSADLLHVTKDRTPSISFRITNPSDPKSIEEWLKQMAMIAVRPKPGQDKEGNVDPSAPKDTIEVHGYFTEPSGFFALTSYLNYARRELRRCNDWAQLAKRKKGADYEFPWREIDESGLEAQGFIDKQFEFVVDQAKILDLLTGHTLYNDTSVVLRELVQNSLDAIRLRWEAESGPISQGEVRIELDTAKRTLVVEDNGTGMTQRVIDDHFLKVGSSLYQDQDFRKLHPNFSPISRFGIGVLSTFMISDEIEITTCHGDDQEARRLSLRSLHGKYLIRLIEKDSPQLPDHIRAHGTHIQLKIRPSAQLQGLASALQRWIVFPRCRVSLTVDGGKPVAVGFSDPRQALEKYLGITRSEGGPRDEPKEAEIRVEQRSKDGVTLAYALEWSKFFQEWTFYSLRQKERVELYPTGTCVEGVRVDFGSPGYPSIWLCALANVVGRDAPKTNVARSGFEITGEQTSMLKTIYELYCQHVNSEVDELQSKRSFSLSWAIGEATWLLNSILPNPAQAGRPSDHYDLLLGACADVRCIALEEHGSRVGISPNDLAKRDRFWTADSTFFSSAETLLREIPTSSSIGNLVGSIGEESLRLPPGPYISIKPSRSVAQSLAFQSREVRSIVLHRDQRRVDLEWTNRSDPPRWRNAMIKNGDNLRAFIQLLNTSQRGSFASELENIWIARAPVNGMGLDGETAIKSIGRTFVLPGTDYASYLIQLLDEMETTPDQARIAACAVALQCVSFGAQIPNAAEFVRQEISMMRRAGALGSSTDLREDSGLISVLQSTQFKLFNSQAWTRN